MPRQYGDISIWSFLPPSRSGAVSFGYCHTGNWQKNEVVCTGFRQLWEEKMGENGIWKRKCPARSFKKCFAWEQLLPGHFVLLQKFQAHRKFQFVDKTSCIWTGAAEWMVPLCSPDYRHGWLPKDAGTLLQGCWLPRGMTNFRLTVRLPVNFSCRFV